MSSTRFSRNVTDEMSLCTNNVAALAFPPATLMDAMAGSVHVREGQCVDAVRIEGDIVGMRGRAGCTRYRKRHRTSSSPRSKGLGAMTTISASRPNCYEGSDGYSVEILGRTGLRYREGPRSMFVDSEVLATPGGIVIYTSTIARWEPPHEAEELHADAPCVWRRTVQVRPRCGASVCCRDP